MATTVVVVQHGAKPAAPGDPGLTPAGVVQARRVAATLAGWAPVPAALCTSPQRRAMETAAPIAAALGVRAVVDARWRERMNWDGPPVQSLDDFLAEWQACSRDRDLVPARGESSHGAARRFLAGLDDLAATHPHRTVVVVSHGGVTTDTLRTLLGDDGLAAVAPTLMADGVPPGALTRVVHSAGEVGAGWRVAAVATTRHLD